MYTRAFLTSGCAFFNVSKKIWRELCCARFCNVYSNVYDLNLEVLDLEIYMANKVLKNQGRNNVAFFTFSAQNSFIIDITKQFY